MNEVTQNTFFSNGNLIITGEYFVLTGAKALAAPLKYGQQMMVTSIINDKPSLLWKATEQGKPWFNANFNSEDLNIIDSNNDEIALGLQKLLSAALELKPLLFNDNTTYEFSSDIQFSISWGWGSSATLISNIANWAGIDPFELNKQVSSGSGYDIAASNSATPILYQLTKDGRKITPVAFKPEFRENIYFVYLGRKQKTSTSIEKTIEVIRRENMASTISELTERIATESSLKEFVRCIVEHEIIVSKTLKLPRVKSEYFNDFDGEIKSLGAWGGDFAMVISQLPKKRIKNYFRDKGLETFFGFDEIIKKLA
ncbi:MAG: GHMP kinase [Bacteroidales bacterium]|nr:MAG: GHMP kinase [Bacteroidales bacterium]